ncbi:MAG: hypothetical protein M3337_08095 [Actinomycetota bacterium]|nr:hypothetical protein [Actinomycetota bacterium]
MPMNVGLTIAGSLGLVLALGHTIASRVILAALPAPLPASRFGDGQFTRHAVVDTFYSLSVMLAAPGVVLLALASIDHVDHRGLLVGMIGASYAATLFPQAWMNRRQPSRLLRLPPFWLVVAISALCWTST